MKIADEHYGGKKAPFCCSVSKEYTGDPKRGLRKGESRQKERRRMRGSGGKDLKQGGEYSGGKGRYFMIRGGRGLGLYEMTV